MSAVKASPETLRELGSALATFRERLEEAGEQLVAAVTEHGDSLKTHASLVDAVHSLATSSARPAREASVQTEQRLTKLAEVLDDYLGTSTGSGNAGSGGSQGGTSLAGAIRPTKPTGSDRDWRLGMRTRDLPGGAEITSKMMPGGSTNPTPVPQRGDGGEIARKKSRQQQAEDLIQVQEWCEVTAKVINALVKIAASVAPDLVLAGMILEGLVVVGGIACLERAAYLNKRHDLGIDELKPGERLKKYLGIFAEKLVEAME
ncbi:hypothetical protein FHR83_008672 [Actinoplanes campanulatus]|uniref:Uncharacterized protein n=1 Tax=Actinoplanes campanulatus TaxID=113559 RepID=A0A7W5FJW5_9ACTN|nr:hypothetical protein [Actinoplanes campanulatus]MBB3100945.1 hypothetical protein [Actinoplanes campanulatus]GGN48882.1 hypothetical protein GCM10010109_86360 [Actinoplanes campanulatus]GID41762.1 hypothetical protein Aca09nite_82680 [Actinoplanes campanulatus]